jgi:hypothetical protein
MPKAKGLAQQAFLPLALLMSGCSSVSLHGEYWGEASPSKPSYLVKVDTLGASKKVSPDKDHVSDLLAAEIVQALQARRPAYWTRDSRQQINTARPPHNLVHVVIVKQEPGSRLLRSLVGWGAGGTKLETQTTVFAPAGHKVPTAKLATTGGSGAMPGALFTDPFMFLPAATLLAGTTGLTYDARRTARTIAQSILRDHALEPNIPAPKRINDHWSQKLLPPLRHHKNQNL